MTISTPFEFTKAIVRKPCENMINGLSEAYLGRPDYDLACEQHADYISALKECGLEVTVLEPLSAYADSCFVEDVALLTPECAILTHPGAPSRQGEVEHIEAAVREHFDKVEKISGPGHVEAGDIMMVGRHHYIGLSDRTNSQGAQQLITLLEQYGLSGEVVVMSEMLHLKTGLSYLENARLLACGEFVRMPQFNCFYTTEIPLRDSYSANSVWINDRVLVPAGFTQTSAAITAMGYQVREVEMSEFQKLDGGLSCLSLRFQFGVQMGVQSVFRVNAYSESLARARVTLKARTITRKPFSIAVLAPELIPSELQQLRSECL